MSSRFLIPGFHRGVINASWAAKAASQEQGLGVSGANNVVLDPDGGLARRNGTVPFRTVDTSAPDTVDGRIFRYTYRDLEFAIVMSFDDTTTNNRTIKVYELTAGAWSTTAINWRENNTTDGRGQFPPFMNTASASSVTTEAHWYTEAEAHEVQGVQFEDDLFLVHPSHPTIRIRRQANSVWDFDPYYMERNPPELFGVRSGITYSIAFNAVVDYDVTVNKELFGVSRTSAIAPPSGTAPSAVAYDGTNSVKPGSIYRFGDIVITNTSSGETEQSIGSFWMLQLNSDGKNGNISPIFNMTNPSVGSGTQTYSGLDTNSPSFAGPWDPDGGTRTASTFVSTHNTAVTIASAASLGWLPKDIGSIVVAPTHETAYFVNDVDTGADTVDLINIGKDVTVSGTSGTFEMYRPEFPQFHIGEHNSGYGGSGVECWCVGDTPIPENHDTTFVDSGWLRPKGFFDSTNQDVGGAIFVGDAIFRCETITEVLATAEDRVQKIVCRKQLIGSERGPFRDYGWGPSHGAGFAAAGVGHQQRMFWAGFEGTPSAVVASAINRVKDMNTLAETGFADAPLNLRMAFQEGDLPKWLASTEWLTIGCESGEYIMDGEPISTSSLQFKRVGLNGSARTQPVQIGARVIWVGNNGRDVYEAVFNDKVNAVEAKSILRQSDDILPAGDTIVHVITIGAPDRKVYFLTSAGKILVLSVSEEFGTRGWTTWDLPASTDTVQSMAKVRKADDTGWDLWLMTRRTLGTVLQAIEIMDDSVYMDIQKTGTALSSTSATFLGFSGLSSAVVGLIVDGVWGGTVTTSVLAVADLSHLNLTGTPTEVLAGLVYDATIDVHFPAIQTDQGTSAGALVNLSRPVLFMEDSIGGTVENKVINNVPVGTDPTPITDWIAVVGSGIGPNSRFPTIQVKQSLPWAFKLGAVAFEGGTDK